jgi:hypothetical protein
MASEGFQPKFPYDNAPVAVLSALNTTIVVLAHTDSDVKVALYPPA